MLRTPLLQSFILQLFWLSYDFISSVHAQYLVSYRPPHRVAGEEYGYDVELVHQMSTSMFG